MRWRRKGLTEAECHLRLYGGSREIRVIRPDEGPMATLRAAKLRRLLGRKAA